MSRRGGGRHNEYQRQQPSPASGSSSGRGRGRGRGGGGRSGGGSGGSYGPVSVPSSSRSPPASQPPAVSEVGSTSTAAASLSLEVEQHLTLDPPAASETPLAQAPPASSKALRYPARPGFGTVGSKCLVKANHFLVELVDKDPYQYDVSITPEVTSRGVNRAVMHQLTTLYSQSHLGNRKPAYDGRKSLYTAGPLPFTSKDFVIKLDDKGGKTDSKRRDREFKVAIKFASRADITHLQEFLRGRQMDVPQETLQVLDVVLRESPSKNYTVVARSFFSPKLGPRGEIGDGLECWRGYYQSLRPTQMGLSLNIDLSATSFYEPLPIIDFVPKFLNIRDLSRPLSDQDRVKIKKALKGVRVEVMHTSETKRYKISGITTQPTSQLMFPVDEQGTKMSVVQYFLERYKIRLQFAFLPSLQAGSDSKPIYLPMEICRIVEGQRYSKKLNEKQVTNLLRAACKRPNERERSIFEIAKHNKYNDDEFAKEFGIKINNQLTSVDARVLPPPMLKYHDTGRDSKIHPRVGQWNMINSKMVNGGVVDFWACVCFSTRLNQDTAYQFCQDLVSMCSSKGMVFRPQPLLTLQFARPNQIEKYLSDVHRQSVEKITKMGEKGKQLQLLIIILPDVSGSYGKIKRICETELGIVSQCCQPRQAAKLNKQYLENVSLKVNVKVGGRNNVLVDAIQKRIPLVTDYPTIIFGADVTHPQPGEDSSPSIAAVVASMDWPEVTKYRCLVSAQQHRMEIIQDLYKVVQDPQKGTVHSGMIRELLIAFRRSTGHKPYRIIFYRDGVSEGQFSQVLLYELDAIRKACRSLEDGYLPPVTFVVVQKRHHTRLFPADHNNRDLTDRSGNILPGTVVDRKICHPSEFDFYLCSHAGIQGTSRPTHYHVLWDENKFTADGLQILTNNLCYTYARCTRSVSIVPPAYYAHLAAFRARYYIEGDASDSGSGTGGGRNTREQNLEVRVLPSIKDNVKDVMFYC